MRDTDKGWEVIAEHQPYFGVLTDQKFVAPTEADLEEFFASGHNAINSLLAELRDNFGPFDPHSALDFGCGVGRLAIPMAQVTGEAVGVDIAEGMLKLARMHAEQKGANLSLTREVPVGRQFDWVNTMIVLQHIPPTRGYRIIRDLWGCVAPGGCLSLHLTIYKDHRYSGYFEQEFKLFRTDGETAHNYTDEEDGIGMFMYDYDLSRVFALLDLPQGQKVVMSKMDHGGCHAFIIYVRKRPA